MLALWPPGLFWPPWPPGFCWAQSEPQANDANSTAVQERAVQERNEATEKKKKENLCFTERIRSINRNLKHKLLSKPFAPVPSTAHVPDSRSPPNCGAGPIRVPVFRRIP